MILSMLFIKIRGKCTSANDDTLGSWYFLQELYTVAFKTSPNKASFFLSSSVSSVIVTAPSDMFSLCGIYTLHVHRSDVLLNPPNVRSASCMSCFVVKATKQQYAPGHTLVITDRWMQSHNLPTNGKPWKDGAVFAANLGKIAKISLSDIGHRTFVGPYENVRVCSLYVRKHWLDLVILITKTAFEGTLD